MKMQSSFFQPLHKDPSEGSVLNSLNDLLKLYVQTSGRFFKDFQGFFIIIFLHKSNGRLVSVHLTIDLDAITWMQMLDRSGTVMFITDPSRILRRFSKDSSVGARRWKGEEKGDRGEGEA